MTIRLALALAAFVALSTTHYLAYSAGKQSIITRLADDRVTVLQDGKRIDENVFAADDNALYCMLVSCDN